MTYFTLPELVDIVCCVYDSINQLLSFDKWIKTFKQVYANLNPEVLFIFDMNTLKKLEEISNHPAYSVL